MTLEELAKVQEDVEAGRRTLDRLASLVELMIEEAAGRPDSQRARFARAHLSGDLSTMDAICAANTAARFRETGRWDAHQAQAERLLAAGE